MEITMHNTRFLMPAQITAKVEEIMAASRARFGHDAFRMEDAPADPPPADDPQKGDPPPADPPADDQPPADLGDAGKKALDAMKAKWKEAESKAKVEADARAALEAKIAGTEAEHAAQREAQKLKDEFLAVANTRIVSAELRAAAKGKIAEDVLPDLALFIKPSDFEVGEDGSVDTDAIAQAIDDLIKNKPSLAAQGGQRFQGSTDGGARNGSQASLDDQIAEATTAGNFQLAIALKQRRSAELAAKKS